MEQWHPLGPVGVITRVQFSGRGLGLERGARLGLRRPTFGSLGENPAHGDGRQAICERVCRETGAAGISSVLIGVRKTWGKRWRPIRACRSSRATGSCQYGTEVGASGGRAAGALATGTRRQQRDDRHATADLELAVQSSFRRRRHLRPTLHDATAADRAQSAAPKVGDRLKSGYKTLPIGNPLIARRAGRSADRRAVVDAMRRPHCGGQCRRAGCLAADASRGRSAGGFYVRPAVVDARSQLEIVQQETFAPILYLMTYRRLRRRYGHSQQCAAGARRHRSSPPTCARPNTSCAPSAAIAASRT